MFFSCAKEGEERNWLIIQFDWLIEMHRFVCLIWKNRSLEQRKLLRFFISHVNQWTHETTSTDRSTAASTRDFFKTNVAIFWSMTMVWWILSFFSKMIKLFLMNTSKSLDDKCRHQSVHCIDFFSENLRSVLFVQIETERSSVNESEINSQCFSHFLFIEVSLYFQRSISSSDFCNCQIDK